MAPAIVDDEIDHLFHEYEGVSETKDMHNGIDITDKSVYVGFSALADFPHKIQLMTSAEAWFLKAEAAVRGWAGAGSGTRD